MLGSAGCSTHYPIRCIRCHILLGTHTAAVYIYMCIKHLIRVTVFLFNQRSQGSDLLFFSFRFPLSFLHLFMTRSAFRGLAISSRWGPVTGYDQKKKILVTSVGLFRFDLSVLFGTQKEKPKSVL
jgi:hypothetical protein